MGLFKRKKKAIEKAVNDEIHDIVCLYCFRSFTHDRVLFRALETLDEDGYRAAADRALDEYRELFGMDAPGLLPAVLNPAKFKEVSKGYHRGVLSSLVDAYGNETTRRVCPHCHNDLPQSAAFAPSTVISVVGAPRSGKSAYLTSLIHSLKTVTPRHFQIFCTPLNNETGRRFKYEYEDPLIENGYLPSPAPKGKQQEPFVFTFSFTDGSKPEVNIAFFEMADERAADNDLMEMYDAYVRNSSGVMLLVDPLQLGSVSRRIISKNQMDYDTAHTRDPADALTRLTDAYESRVPTAVVVTKSDLLAALADDGDYFRPGSKMFTSFTHKGVVNIDAIENIREEVEEFIAAAEPNLRNALTRRFAELGFFAVSALGARPDAIRQRGASFAPLRVDEPFLWLLYKLGFLEGNRP
jgi:hypothetical protein